MSKAFLWWLFPDEPAFTAADPQPARIFWTPMIMSVFI
jgi:hypothetical protein